MKDNGDSKVWIVVQSVMGDMLLEVPSGVSIDRKLPDEFTVYRILTLYHSPVIDENTGEHKGVAIKKAEPMLFGLGAVGGVARMRSNHVFWWAIASDDAAEQARRFYSPVAKPTPDQTRIIDMESRRKK